jgi:hypothetical protein
MGEAVRQLAVVREQDQSGRVRIEATDRVEAAPGVDQLGHRAASARLASSRDDALRLVERPDLTWLGRDPFPIHLDLGAFADISGGSVTTSPPTRTRPATINLSAERRDATPEWARYLASLIPRLKRRGGGAAAGPPVRRPATRLRELRVVSQQSPSLARSAR